MSLGTGLRLRVGEPAPLQRSRVTCGAACLTVARMMVDPALVHWIAAAPPGEDRFARHERAVLARTNAVRPGPGRWQAPWPRALGTPPWGAAWELEQGAARPAQPYGVEVVRGGARERLEALPARLADGVPALLYVGDDVLPRHVVLAFVHDDDPVRLYDPGSGRVSAFDPAATARGAVNLSGWRRPWLLVVPRGRTVEAPALATAARRVRWWAPAPEAAVLSRGSGGGA